MGRYKLVRSLIFVLAVCAVLFGQAPTFSSNRLPRVVYSNIVTGQNTVSGGYSTIYTTPSAGIYRISATIYPTTASSTSWSIEVASNISQVGSVGTCCAFNLTNVNLNTSNSEQQNSSGVPLNMASGALLQVGTFTLSGANTGGVYTYAVIIERMQ